MVKPETMQLLDKIFTIWFKNITVLIAIVIGGVLVYFSLKNGWIGQDFAIELIFFILGIMIGLWLEKRGFKNG
ncbi:MAG: hypothetical protein AB1668_00850 [Nanoarchaeota archaeon]